MADRNVFLNYHHPHEDMTMGFISGFVSGAAKATSDLALFNLKEKADRERIEAEAVRRRALTEYEQGMEDARLDKKMGFEKEENRLDRESEERRAGMYAAARSKPMKIGEDDMGRPIFGVYNDETGWFDPIDVAVSDPANAELTPAELERARVELSTADGKDKANDWIPFNEPSRDQIYAKALENRRGGSDAAKVGTTKPSAKTADGPTFEEYAAKVRQANPGAEIPEADLRAKYESRFGKAQTKKPPKGAINELMRDPSPDAISEFNEIFGAGTAEGILGDKPTAAKPAKKSKTERIAEIEARLKADDDLKAPGSGGILGRAMKVGRMPMGIAQRRRLENELAQLRKEIGTTAK